LLRINRLFPLVLGLSHEPALAESKRCSATRTFPENGALVNQRGEDWCCGYRQEFPGIRDSGEGVEYCNGGYREVRRRAHLPAFKRSMIRMLGVL